LTSGSLHQICMDSRNSPSPPAAAIIMLRLPSNRRSGSARKAVRNMRSAIASTCIVPKPIRSPSTQTRPGTNTLSICIPNRAVSARRPSSVNKCRSASHPAKGNILSFLITAPVLWYIAVTLTSIAPGHHSRYVIPGQPELQENVFPRSILGKARNYPGYIEEDMVEHTEAERDQKLWYVGWAVKRSCLSSHLMNRALAMLSKAVFAFT